MACGFCRKVRGVLRGVRIIPAKRPPKVRPK